MLVLKYPEIPLHNNDAEPGARAQVRKQDVSLHTMTKNGTKANDTFITLYSASIEAVQQLLSIANPLLPFRFKSTIHLLFIWILNYWTAFTEVALTIACPNRNRAAEHND